MIKLSNDVRAEMHRLAEQAGVRLHPTAKQAEEAAERARAAAAVSQKFGEAALLFKAETTPGSDWPSQGPTIRLCTGQRHVVGRKTIDYGVASDDVVNIGNGESPVLVRLDPLAQIGKIDDKGKAIDHRANCILRGGPADGTTMYLADVRYFAFVRGDGDWLYERSQCHELRCDRSLSVFKFKGKDSKVEKKQATPKASDDGADAELGRSLAEAYLVALQRVPAVRLRQMEEARKAQETDAAKYRQQFETLVAQLDALWAPPSARRPGVKPAISGLTRTVAEDHRLGRFKG